MSSRTPPTDAYDRAIWAAGAALRKGWCSEAEYQLRIAKSVFPSFTASHAAWKKLRTKFDRLSAKVKACKVRRGA